MVRMVGASPASENTLPAKEMLYLLLYTLNSLITFPLINNWYQWLSVATSHRVDGRCESRHRIHPERVAVLPLRYGQVRNLNHPVRFHIQLLFSAPPRCADRRQSWETPPSDSAPVRSAVSGTHSLLLLFSYTLITAVAPSPSLWRKFERLTFQ